MKEASCCFASRSAPNTGFSVCSHNSDARGCGGEPFVMSRVGTSTCQVLAPPPQPASFLSSSKHPEGWTKRQLTQEMKTAFAGSCKHSAKAPVQLAHPNRRHRSHFHAHWLTG